eukprot:TRINITY_DN21899_c0_g1_i1.p1 TRINITY_DN21899_c0_g1~~TRINITY_DN21899_c0_g1_i1.p1  ORF type:complete len:229 (-),score=37.10 TRINITY_DN21899_c0_g1_i1:296-982(-)
MGDSTPDAVQVIDPFEQKKDDISTALTNLKDVFNQWKVAVDSSELESLSRRSITFCENLRWDIEDLTDALEIMRDAPERFPHITAATIAETTRWLRDAKDAAIQMHSILKDPTGHCTPDPVEREQRRQDQQDMLDLLDRRFRDDVCQTIDCLQLVECSHELGVVEAQALLLDQLDELEGAGFAQQPFRVKVAQSLSTKRRKCGCVVGLLLLLAVVVAAAFLIAKKVAG